MDQIDKVVYLTVSLFKVMQIKANGHGEGVACFCMIKLVAHEVTPHPLSMPYISWLFPPRTSEGISQCTISQRAMVERPERARAATDPTLKLHPFQLIC